MTTTTRTAAARVATVTAGLLAGLLLTGCTAQDQEPDQGGPGPTAEESAPTTPMTAEEAREHYTDLADTANASVPAFQAAGASGDQVALRSLATERADVLEEFAEGLRAREWPADVQPAVDRLAAQISVEVPLWREAGEVELDDDEAYQATLDRLPGLPAAQEVRTALELDVE